MVERSSEPVTKMERPERDWLPLIVAPFATVPTDQRAKHLGALNDALAEAVRSLEVRELEKIRIAWSLGIMVLRTTWQQTKQNLHLRPLDLSLLKSFRYGPDNEKYRQFRNHQIELFWTGLTSGFREDLIFGRINAVARVKSPFASSFTEIASDAWRHVRMIDWAAGTADTDTGERLFSIYVLPGAGSGPDTEVERKLSRTKRPSVQAIALNAFMLERYPDGKPAGVSFDALSLEYSEWVQGRDETRTQSWPRTITDRGVAKILKRNPRSERSEQ